MPENLTAFNPESRYVGAALKALGLSPDEFFPPDVRAAFAELERPADLKWQGRPVWNTAVVTGLRAVAKARRQARAEAQPQGAAEFNEAWSAEFLDIPESLTGEKATKVGGAALQDLVAVSHRELDRAARNVKIANTILTTPDSALPSAAWSHQNNQNVARAELQSNVADSLRWFTVQPPTLSEEIATGQHPEFPNSFLVIAPTASGKTKMAGDWLAKQGVGADVPGQRSPRVLWVTDQQRLINDVLDPSKTLSRCLPDDTELTAVWEGHKTAADAAGHLVGVTGASIKEAVLGLDDKRVTWDLLIDQDSKKATGEPLINPDDYDIVVFDEGDIMTSELKKSIIPMFNDCKKLFLTATPFRNERQDLQRMMHSVRPVKLLEAVDQGIIAPVRMFTFPARDAKHAETIAAFLACEMFLKEGKRAIMYCQPGQESAQARRITEATRLRMIEEFGEDYDAIVSMVGSSQPDSWDVIDAFEASPGPGILATRKMLRRGWDPARLDGCILVGNQGDIIEFEQGIGRTLRIEPDNPDKIAYIIQIPYPGGVGAVPYTAEMIFGFDTVMNGATLGRQTRGGANKKKGSSRDYDVDEALAMRIAELAEAMDVAPFALGTPLAEAFIAPDDPRYHLYVKPEGYDTSLGELVQRYPHITRTWFHNHLSKFAYGDLPGVPSAIIRSVMPVEVDEAARRYERYYDSEGVAAFLEKVVIPGPITGSLSATKLAEYLDVPTSMLREAAKDLEIIASNRFDADAKTRAGTRYDPAEIARITEWVEEIPLAENGQVWMPELRKQYGHYVKYYLEQQQIVPKTYRHPPEALVKGHGSYVEAEHVAAMGAAYERIEGLMATHRSLEQIGKNVGMAAVRLLRNLSPEESSQIVTFEPLGKQTTRHLPNNVADMVEARLGAARPPEEVPRKVLGSATGVLGVTLDSAARRFKLSPRMAEDGRRQGLFHIGALEEIVAKYRSRPSFPAELLDIQFDRLPIKGQEPTEEQLVYAQEVQGILQKLAASPAKESAELPAAVVELPETLVEPVAVVEAPVIPVVPVAPIAPETPVVEPPKQETVVGQEVIELVPAKEAGIKAETAEEIFFDVQAVTAEVNCLPHALPFLLSRAHRSWGGRPKVDARVYLKDSGYESDGVIAQLSDSVLKRTEFYIEYDNNLKKAPPAKWYGHSSFAQHNGLTAESLQALLTKSYDSRELNLNEKEWSLHMVDGKIEVFYAPNFKNRVLKVLSSRRR